MISFIVHAKGFVRETTAELLRERGVPVVEVDDAAAAVDHLDQEPTAVLVCSEVPPIESWAEQRRVVLLDGVADEAVVRLRRRGARVARVADGTVRALLDAAFAVDPPDEDAPVVQLASGEEERPVLTRRQLQVVQLIARGCTSQEIARALGVRPKTVENYKQRVFLRLGVQNQAHAVARCARLGLMDGPYLNTLAS